MKLKKGFWRFDWERFRRYPNNMPGYLATDDMRDIQLWLGGIVGCCAMPMDLYPDQEDLPVHRAELPIWPELSSNLKR